MKWSSLILSLLISLPLHAKLSVATYNIRNFNYDTRSGVHTDTSTLADIIKTASAELMGVSEINDVIEFQRFIKTQFPDYDVILSQCGGANEQRLGYIFNKKKLNLLSFKEDLSFSDPGGAQGGCNSGSRPLGVAEFEEVETGTRFFALHVHFKSGSQPEAMQKRFKQYDLLANTVLQLSKSGHSNFVVTGDFNSTSYITRGEDFSHFQQMLAKTNLVNLSQNNKCSVYWWGGKDDGIEYPSLLDHVLISQSFLKNKKAETRPLSHCQKLACNPTRQQDMGRSYEAVSDHCPLVATPR
jgi:endonuclease/exonuclease/phosphatase family metal-dependent hydrolase